MNVLLIAMLSLPHECTAYCPLDCTACVYCFDVLLIVLHDRAAYCPVDCIVYRGVGGRVLLPLLTVATVDCCRC